MKKISKDEVLASSSGWVASLLNFLPGLGTGYIYQRRWRQYFLTFAAIIFWFGLTKLLHIDQNSLKLEQLIGLSGLILISLITVIEANIAYQKSRKISEKN